VRLVASGVITREINNEQALDFGATWCDAAVVPLRSYFILFPNLFTFLFVLRPNFAKTALLTLRLLSPSFFSFFTRSHDTVLVLILFRFASLHHC
jgi:hypothetical protein